MLISYNIPDLEIHRSKQPVALIVSAGYIKPHRIIARGNYFVMNDKKVKGMYTIVDKFRLMWDYTPVYFYVVQETNPINPIMIDRINHFMAVNKIVKLKIKDVRHGALLRSLYVRADKEETLQEEKKKSLVNSEIPNIENLPELPEDENLSSHEKALRLIDSIEKSSGNKLDEILTQSVAKIQEYEETQRKAYDRPYFVMPDSKKSYRLLRYLKEQGLIDDAIYANFLFKVENHILSFDLLIEELREMHMVRVVEPIDEETERFIQDLGMQYEQEKAGHTQDLIGSKRGLKTMLARPIHSIMSFYVMIPASLVTNIFDLELHPSFPTTPIALIISHGRIIRKKIKTKGNYFVVKDKKIRGIYSKLNECQYMWGKVPCYVYAFNRGVNDDKELLKQVSKYVNKKEFGRTIQQQQKIKESADEPEKKKSLFSSNKKPKEIKPKTNSLLDYLLKVNKITREQYDELWNKVSKRDIDPDELMDELYRLRIFNPVIPLNLSVNDFIQEIGAVNAQEWAGLTQDCRNITKGLDDMTSKPVKAFLSAGVVLAIGLSVTIAAVVIPANLPDMMKGMGGIGGLGGGGKSGGLNLNPFAAFGGHFILGSSGIMSWLSLHTPWLLDWLI